MKYITPDLIERMNDPSMKVIMRALEEWEERLAAYEARLKRIKAKLPQSVRRYLATCRLHDAEFIGAGHVQGARSKLVMLVHQGDRLISLEYELAGRVDTSVVLPEKFRSSKPLWMYDEFELGRDGVIEHHILISSGEELTVRFRKFEVVEGNWLLPAQNGNAAKAKKKAVPA
jgi:hypothetical protein